MNARRHAGSRQLCLLALSCSDRRVRTLLLCAGLIALCCCAVLAVDSRQHASHENAKAKKNKMRALLTEQG